LLIGLPILALSTWYTIVALIWFVGIVLIYLLLRDRDQFLSGIQNIKISLLWYFRKSTSWAIFSCILFVSMLFTFLYIYGSRFNDQEFAAWSSTVFYAPRLFDIVNASFAATGWQGEMYKTVRLDIYPTFERAMGLSVSILILLAIGLLLIIFKKQNFTVLERSLSFAAIFTLIAPLTDERGQSLWYFISKFPILNSVRSPARFWTFSSVIITWVVIWIIWRNLNSVKLNLKQLLILSILLLSILQVRTPMANWTNNDLLSDFGKKSELTILKNNCDYFYISSADNLDLFNSIGRQIDGMIIAVANDKKTINGYASSPPPDWPQKPVWGLVEKDGLLPWLEKNEKRFTGTTCFLDEKGVSFYEKGKWVFAE
jgi:hypothetical protein